MDSLTKAINDLLVVKNATGVSADEITEAISGNGVGTVEHFKSEFIAELKRENAKLRETGNALRDYLTAKVGPIEDIPDEIFGPFIEALKP
jgi:hypothetical protein